MKFCEYSHNNGVTERTFSDLQDNRNRGEAMEVNVRYLQQFPVKESVLDLECQEPDVCSPVCFVTSQIC